MKAEDYHRLDALSNSVIRVLLQKSAQHARMQQLCPDLEPSAQMERGTALHSLILEGIDIITPIDAADFRTKAAQEAREDARAQGRIPIIAAKAEEIYAIAKTAKEQIQNGLGIELTADGQAEVTLQWQEGATPCKARLDWLSNSAQTIIDLKITELSPSAFIRSIASSGYDIQDSFYRRGVKAVHGSDARFIFAVCEAAPPYPVYFVELDAAFRAIGEAKIERALQVWGACRESNIYPCYSQEIMRAEPPVWEMAAAEEIDAETHGFDKAAFLFGKVRT